MIRHVSLLTWADGTTAAQHDAVVAALEALPAQIPEIASYRLGTDAGLAEGNANLAVMADFADVADYETYRDHPAHQAVLGELIKPILAGRTAIQHELHPSEA